MFWKFFKINILLISDRCLCARQMYCVTRDHNMWWESLTVSVLLAVELNQSVRESARAPVGQMLSPSPSLWFYSHSGDSSFQITLWNHQVVLCTTPPPAAITTRAKHCTVFVGGITGLYWKSEIWAMTKSSVELLYCTSPNQTQHCPVSHIATSLVRLSLIHARLLMVDMLTDISWSFSFWVVLIALEKLKEQLCLNCSKLCIMLSIYPLHDTWLSSMQPAG